MGDDLKSFYVFILSIICLNVLVLPNSFAQQQSVRPGINDSYMDPDWQYWVNQFERSGREVFDRRFEIVKASGVTPGMAVADIGAGTGLFTRLFSQVVGPGGKVFAVDISRPFVENILRESHERGLMNVIGVVNSPKDAMLERQSIDLAFTVDTYHHFEYPKDMLDSIYEALRPNGRLIVIDFRKNPGFSSGWVMGHVRANKNKVISEITSNGFQQIDDKPFLGTNYFLEFRKIQ